MFDLETEPHFQWEAHGPSRYCSPRTTKNLTKIPFYKKLSNCSFVKLNQWKIPSLTMNPPRWGIQFIIETNFTVRCFVKINTVVLEESISFNSYLKCIPQFSYYLPLQQAYWSINWNKKITSWIFFIQQFFKTNMWLKLVLEKNNKI